MNSMIRAGWRLLIFGSAMAGAAEAAAESCDVPLARAIQATKALWSAQPHGDDYAKTFGELALIDAACTRGKDVEAAWRLEQIQRPLAPRAVPQRVAVRSHCQTSVRFSNSCSLVADARTGRRTLNVDPTPSTLSALTSP